MNLRTIFGREPALWLGAFQAALQLVALVALPLTQEQQGAINALIVFLLGAVGSGMVAGEKTVPFLVGLAQAIATLLLTFGVHLDPALLTTVTGMISAFGALVTRQLVVAKVAPSGAIVAAAPASVQQITSQTGRNMAG